MGSLLSADEIERGLIAQGVPKDRARAAAMAQVCAANLVQRADTPPSPPSTLTTTHHAETLTVRLTTGPITLRLPWSCLISDNDKHVVEKGTGRRFKTKEYKAAKARIRLLAKDVMNGRAPTREPLSFVARVWMPDRRRHDVINFGKCTIDSLTGIVFVDDAQLYDVRWMRAGVDCDAPRAEITVTPIAA